MSVPQANQVATNPYLGRSYYGFAPAAGQTQPAQIQPEAAAQAGQEQVEPQAATTSPPPLASAKAAKSLADQITLELQDKPACLASRLHRLNRPFLLNPSYV